MRYSCFVVTEISSEFNKLSLSDIPRIVRPSLRIVKRVPCKTKQMEDRSLIHTSGCSNESRDIFGSLFES